MTTKTIKTTLFASLVATLLLPFGMMTSADAERIPVFVEPIKVKIVMTDERQNLIDKVAAIGERSQKAKDENSRNVIIAELVPWKADMKRLGLTPSFDFGEDRAVWDKDIEGVKMIKVTSDVVKTGGTHTDNWHVKHSLKWGCNILVYCTDVWVEWYDLNDWASLTVTLPTVHQSYFDMTHIVTNFSGSSQTETMNGWVTHTRGSTILDDNYDGDVEFWTDHGVESEIIMASWNVQTGDKIYSTSRIT